MFGLKDLESVMNKFKVNSGSLLNAWEYHRYLPKGNKIFSKLLGKFVPYTASIGAEIVELSRGICVVQLTDRRSVRNHLKSIHAIALANLGELTSGLAVQSSIHPDCHCIITEFNIVYNKKARGTLTASARVEENPSLEEHDIKVSVDIKNETGDVVATATTSWNVRPIKS